MVPAITALLLDVDDTLIDTRAAMVAAGEAAVAELWPEVGAQVHHAAGVHFHRDPGNFFGRFTTGELGFAQMREARIADLVETFALTAIDEVTRQFEEFYDPAFAARVRLFDDVLPFLDRVTAAGIPMGLLTNSASHYTQQKLEITGLESVFRVVVSRDTLGYGKPDPRAFHHACALLGSEPGETMYVGDHVEIDAIAASEAGLRAVWLQRDPGDDQDSHLAQAHGVRMVASLKEVVALLDAD